MRLICPVGREVRATSRCEILGDYKGGLVRLGKLNVDVLAKVVHLEALFVIGKYRTHNIFVAVLFLAQQLTNLFGAFAIEDISENTSGLEGKPIIDEKQINLAVLNSDSSHRPGWFALVEKEDEGRLLFRLNPRNVFGYQVFDRFVF